MKMEISRREFLQTSGTAAASLVIGFHLPVRPARAQFGGPPDPFVVDRDMINAYLTLNPDETVSIVSAAAKKGLDAIEPQWNLGPVAARNSENIREEMLQLPDQPGNEAVNEGDIDAARDAAAQTVTATYEAPYWAHATLEPLNATAHYRGDSIEFWLGAQAPGGIESMCARMFPEVPTENIVVNNQYLGGGFGRRGRPTPADQAALISKQVGKPVKLIWSREEDMTHDTYRPKSVVRMEGYLDDAGRVTGFKGRTAVQSTLASLIDNPDVPVDPFATEGLIDHDYRFPALNDDDGDFKLMQRLLRLAHAPAHKGVDVRQLLFDKARAPELEWSDFDHVADNRDHVERLVAGALESGERGVNVLLYGPPGTGKTQFCRTLAHRLGVTMYSVGEADERGCEPSRGERLQELRLAQRVLGGCRNSILLFDEMEDLLADPNSVFPWFFGPANRRRRRADGSRVFLHRLLEENKAPTLWTTNAACQTSEAVLRRMMYALELRRPSPRVRERIWTRQLKRHGIPSEESDARALAREFDVTPGVAAGATAAARLIDGGDIATVRHGVRSLSRLLHGEKPPQRVPGEFDPRLIQAQTDPVELADRIAEWGARRVSLCLQGPPGSGKSAFVRYLAERIGLEVVQKRASDLMSKWVGDTEKLIAEAFAEARDNRHFLVFDEADSLLSDRRIAHRNWEISQVNEMLTWMESHPLPFACTTNFGEHLDPATLRRFDFKLRLDYLTPDQAVAAFRVFFGLDAPATVRTLSGVTPGDFAVVRRRAEILGQSGDANALAAMLQEECGAKPNRPTRIGFGVNGG